MGITGEEIIYAWKKGAAWGTPIACGAGSGFLGLPLSGEPDNELVVDDSLGQFFAVDASPGKTSFAPSIPGYLRFNDIVILSMLAQFFGTAGVPTVHAGGTISQDHILKMAKQVDGKFGTLCAMLGTGFVEEIPSWKIAKINITWETGQPVKFAFSGPGIDLITNSETNTLATMANVTILERANRAYMGQTEFRINDHHDIALAENNKLGVSKIDLSLERKLTGVYGTYNDAGAGRDLIDEPTNDGQPSGTLSITQSRLQNANGRADVLANTSKKAEIIVTGPIIEDAIPYLIKFQLPHLKPKKNANPHKHGIIENTREYEILGATSAPAGMTGNTDPCWVNLTNKITTDLLA